jgi:hypothetical protein
MSALPLKADIGRAHGDVCFVPKAEVSVSRITGIDSSAFELVALLGCLAPPSEVRIPLLASRHDLRVDLRQSLGGLLSLRRLGHNRPERNPT